MARPVMIRTNPVGPPVPRRTVLEHLFILVPGLYRVLAALVMGLIPRSRLRRHIMRWQMVAGWSSASRRDFELMVRRYHPDVRYEVDERFQMLGLPARLRGREAMIAAVSEWAEEWDHFEFAPIAMVELDDGLLGLGKFKACGRASGIEVDLEYAQLVTLQAGLGAHEHDFIDWAQALRAARLEPGDFVPLLRAADDRRDQPRAGLGRERDSVNHAAPARSSLTRSA